MLITYQNQNSYLTHSLEKLFDKFYNAQILRSFFETTYIPAFPDKVPQRINKSLIVRKLSKLSAADTSKLIESMPKKLRKSFGALLWHNYLPYESFKAETGIKVETFEEHAKLHPFDIYHKQKPEDYMGLIAFYPRPNYYGETSEIPPNSVSLPPAIKAWLQPHFPKPKGYYLEPATQEPKASKTSHLFEYKSDRLNELIAVSDYLIRTSLQITKSGRPTKKTLKELHDTTQLQEFYPDNKGHKYLRSSLLFELLVNIKPETLEQVTKGQITPAKFLKEVLQKSLKSADIYFDYLLPHIKGKGWQLDNYLTDNENTLLPALKTIFSQAPSESWISIAAIERFIQLRSLPLQNLNTNSLTCQLDKLQGEHQHYSTRINTSNHLELLQNSLLKATCFALASIGALEIHYTLPKNLRTQFKNKDYLTHFDGIATIRLTEIGEYLFNQRSKLNLKFEGLQRAGITFHPERLHLNTTQVDPVTENTLKKYLLRQSNNHYTLTRQSIIGKASDKHTLNQRITNFRREIGTELPKHWQDFLDDIIAEQTALTDESLKYTIFQLSEKSKIREAFQKDPKLQELCIKAQGWRILVPHQNINKLKARIRELGFIFE